MWFDFQDNDVYDEVYVSLRGFELFLVPDAYLSVL